MTNNQNLTQAQVVEIEALTSEQLKAVRLNIQSREYNDEQTREAVAEYVADGGNVDDLLATPGRTVKFYLVPGDADFFTEDFEGLVFDTREQADEFATNAYLGADLDGRTSTWEVKPVPESIDQWADRFERAAYLAV